MTLLKRLSSYTRLMRLDKPIGILLLLWPTLWGLWLGSQGKPDHRIFLIFIAGVFLMRSAGCIINDFADRHLDPHVRRTSERPLASGQVTVWEALFLAGLFIFTSFLLVLQCNTLTIQLAFVGVGLALIYPFLKRFTSFPQVGLGAAFAFSIPMAFAAETGAIPKSAWFLFFTSMVWPVIYDTMYAMVDREDDRKMGVRSTAILFGTRDKWMIGFLQLLFLFLLGMVGLLFHLHFVYYFSLFFVALLFLYQQWLIRNRDPIACFAAFLNNQWVGFLIFIGILLSYPL